MEILTYVLQAILILLFAFAGIGKVAGTTMHVNNFEHWRLPQWFRVVLGSKTQGLRSGLLSAAPSGLENRV